MRTKKATDWPQGKSLIEWVIGIIFFFIPSPNKENEKKFYLLAEWLIEFDNEGCPYREIGLDRDGEPIIAVKATDKECGFWLDTNMRFQDFKDSEDCVINEDVFNTQWSKIRKATK